MAVIKNLSRWAAGIARGGREAIDYWKSILDGVDAGTASASKIPVLGANKDIDQLKVDQLSLPSTTGNGIRLGDPGSSTFGWRDILGQVSTKGVGATDPGWTQMASGPFYAYSFALNDEAWFIYHAPHDLLPSADIFFHAHWTTDGTNVNSVKWQWDYTLTKGFDQEAFSTSGTQINCEEAASGVAFQHMTTETAAISLANWTEPDAILLVHLTRVTNGDVDNTDEIFLLEADVHYQSTGLPTLNRSPSFYGT